MLKIRKAVFPVNGQGTFIYTIKKKSTFTIFVTPNKQKMKNTGDDTTHIQDDEDNGFEADGTKPFDTDDFISLTVGDHFAKFRLKMAKSGEDIILTEKYAEDIGIETDKMVSYWFSYDRDELVLKYGKGHVMTNTTHLSFPFLKDKSPAEQKEIRRKYQKFFNPNQKKYVVVESTNMAAGELSGPSGIISVQQTFQFMPNPLVSNFPPLVKDSSEVTLFDLDRDQYMLSSSLPAACQELYANIKDLKLEFPENPIMKLSDAIRYSLETKGKTLYEKLQEKDPKLGYLRVTLGPDKRTAPGIPYVLEIWPKGKGSPIHNHGGTCAVIKNIYGRLTVNVFNKFTKPPEQGLEAEPLFKFDLKEKQITWIAPNWYQTHKLFNNTDDFCATIQCYRYDFTDSIHWPLFDFVGYVEDKEKYVLEEFYPDSDFTFINLRSMVLKEYQEYLERKA